MKSKKFVLAGLVLLAITGLLALAGCKNDTVPEPTRYTVKFETDHGTAPADITVVSGAELTDKDLAIEPEVGDNIFEYWYDKDGDAQKPVEEGYTVTKDVTLVAKWRDRGTVASVTFTPAGGTKFYLGESIEVSLTSEDGATIQYHLGDGSWKDYDAGGKIQVTGDTTITAKATKEGLKPSTVTSATYTVRKLEGITVTTLPARTVYKVGDEVVHKKDGEIGVTAHYDNETTRPVTGTITTDTSTLTQSAGVKPVTVSYKEGGIEVSGQFEIRVLPTILTEGSRTYMEFGEWPQTIKDASVDVYENTSKQMGMFTYYLGSDKNYYVKVTAKPYEDTYTYSDGKSVEKDQEVYFKVEPIKWRVLTEDYKDPDGNSTGKVLLLAESILTGGIPYYHFDREEGGMEWSGPRIIEDKTIHPNNYEHSQIRAWLNGLSYQSKESEGATQSPKDEYKNAGFLQTAFTESARDLIADTTVDNTAASTFGTGESTRDNPYACDKTKDKIFLLSQQEATNSEYGFAASSTRIRVTTDYAKATGVYQWDSSGGLWWLRSPTFVYNARIIELLGGTGFDSFVGTANGGVVPALSISLGEN